MFDEQQGERMLVASKGFSKAFPIPNRGKV